MTYDGKPLTFGQAIGLYFGWLTIGAYACALILGAVWFVAAGPS